MSWFEQGTSNARCTITQFHRPAELKLKRMCRSVCSRMFSERMGVFLFFRAKGGGALWSTVEVISKSQNDGHKAAVGVSACSPFDAP